MTSVRLGVGPRREKGKAAAVRLRAGPGPAAVGLCLSLCSLCPSQAGSSGLLIILTRPMLYVAATPGVFLVWMGSGL